VGAYKVLMETRVVDSKTKREAKAVSFWRRKSVLSLGIIVIIAIVAVLYWNFYPRGPSIEPASIEPEQVPSVVEVEEAPKTIAVLPFENLSSDPEQGYFADGLIEEILNRLAKIKDLSVTSRTSAFSFKDTNKTVQEIAGILKVDHILEGSVRKAGNTLRVTAQLIRAADDRHLWSNQYDRELKDIEDILSIQENIAKAVANELKVTLGIGTSLKQLGGTDNLEAYERYLIAKGQTVEFLDLENQNRARESIDAALAIDPEFALAWALKADTHVFLAAFGPANRAMIEQNAALNAALKAIEIEPNLSSSYIASGFIKMSKGDWIDAGLDFRKALELKTESLSGSEISIVIHYHGVGYFNRAHEILEEMIQHDPLEPNARAIYILNLGYLGEIQRAEEEYERCKNMGLFDSHKSLGDASITIIRMGTVSALSSDKIVYSDPILDVAKEHLNSPKEGLEELRRIFKNEGNLSSADFGAIAICAAYFSDPEFAMDAFEKAVNIEASTLFDCWYPLYREVRQTPRFKEFLKDIGLVDYWNKFGWPDICHQLDNGDFVCD
jgi:TolB-like protein/Tfp pilus assembly protein PilF